ncbi:MAG: leucine-rich repeat domain-containing protein [Roseburia sp.]|nr:leucine-rich repeat domain-containing protein [Roseburia sp.]
MKRNQILTALFTSSILCFGLLCLTLLTPEYAQAAAKSKVSRSVKNGVLTFSGTGALRGKDIAIANKKKINSVKKIVVKRGITSIPINAFYDFKNVKEIVIADSVKKIGQGAFPDSKTLKKVTMPGTFRLVMEEGDEMVYDLEWGYKSRIDTVSFNTPLSLETLACIRSNNLIVSEKDKKYKSIDGVIYSHDGKSIVRVPAYRETLTLDAGCEEFCLSSVLYANMDHEGDTYLKCEKLQKIVLPASVKEVSRSKYQSKVEDRSGAKELIINTDQLDSNSILLLLTWFPISDAEEFLQKFTYISVQDGMCINTRDACLLRYTGKAEEITVPDGVKKIGRCAFQNTEIKRAVLPDSVAQIEGSAFSGCKALEEVHLPTYMTEMGSNVFGACEHLNHVVFPEGMKSVPEQTFESCDGLTEITLPDTVTKIEDRAFSRTSVPASILFQGNIKEICGNAFSVVGWQELVVPATVEKIDAYAFSIPSLERVTVCGSTAGISSKAFCSYYSGSKDTVLTFEKEVEEWQTGLSLRTGGTSHARFKWQKITGVDGWQIQASPYRSFRKKKKTYYAKKGKTEMELTDKKMAMNYIRLRPYKVVDGKRQYGRWAVVTFVRK